MSVRPILRWPDPQLKKKSAPVEAIDDGVKALVYDMFETMYASKGIGLAAPQIGFPRRIIVLDLGQGRSVAKALINPTIVEAWGKVKEKEGCLSVPGIYEPVDRAQRIVCRAHSLEGELQEFEAEGILAACVQHEVDHLDGIVFVEHLSRLKRQMITQKLTRSR